ncbi:sensor histidine kinase [Saccharopolyspora shandongensis]|uniref:sensor histidine kinase n=1 Tax=Saccharopolyspora shandongensis TaxID=418495 RepID=UPI0033ED4913
MNIRLRSCLSAGRYLVIGAATSAASILALVVLLYVLVLCPFGVGIPALPHALRLTRHPAGLERRRAARELGEPIPKPYRNGSPLTDPATFRDLAWLVAHAATGLLLAALAIGLPLGGLRQLAIAGFWWTMPGVGSSLGFAVTSWPLAALCALVGLAFIAATLWLPRLARLQARAAQALLSSGQDAALADRVAELTASRAAALEAHGAELRRIERDLHDGTQARIAAVVLQLGVAGQLYDKDPAKAQGLLVKAQDTATDALAELRTVVRSIYPPLLTERGLDGAVKALAARCPIPVAVRVLREGRHPAAVDAAAYFIVAEMLTNATKHADATEIAVTLDSADDTLLIEIRDDGRGGADESRGSGLAGIRKRVEAFDGTVTLSSPPGGPTVLRVELPCGS